MELDAEPWCQNWHIRGKSFKNLPYRVYFHFCCFFTWFTFLKGLGWRYHRWKFNQTKRKSEKSSPVEVDLAFSTVLTKFQQRGFILEKVVSCIGKRVWSFWKSQFFGIYLFIYITQLIYLIHITTFHVYVNHFYHHF